MTEPSHHLAKTSINVRSVLEYVPYFRGKMFFVHISQCVLESKALVDALLDLDVLSENGVRLCLIVEGEDVLSLFSESVACEMRTARVTVPMTNPEMASIQIERILKRGQIPIVAAGVLGLFPQEVIDLAVSLQASKYICLMEKDEVPTRDHRPIFAISEKSVETELDEVNFAFTLKKAAMVCRSGIPRVHLLDGTRRGVLVDELFSEEGVGTMVYADIYQEIRPLVEADIPELLSMIGRSMQSSDLVERTYDDVLSHLSDYYVLCLDETIVGSVAVHLFPKEKAAEVACLYIKHQHEGHGYGRTMVAFAEDRAKEAGMTQLFAVSKSAVQFFRDRMHFSEWPRENLPMERFESLVKSGRTSGVFGHSLV